MQYMKKNIRNQAFTLTEMLLVVAILALMAALVLPRFAGTTEKANIAAAKTQIGSFSNALNRYEIDTGNYPRTLQALIEQPGDVRGWSGPYLERRTIPLDPWGNAYLYEYPGKNNPYGPDISSAGPDGKPGTKDDIKNWDDKK